MNRLPGTARDLIERLGSAATLRLVSMLGGTTLSVPMRATARGEARYRYLCEFLGPGLADALCREYGGTDLYVPACRAAVMDQRDAALARDRDVMAGAGLSERDIVTGLALKYGLSDRQVWRILKRPFRQTPLFAGIQGRLY